ncbi:DUF29 domain-containing protein [Anabaena sp. FACHB-1237]|uniref:DUF29 domain-containing protein n=1 Tax=Anabaena sp. FACHB-1237 TaxID=2692769 RepID=UPI0016809315|nr:DUF29 domain-containing protein [Anabaena sp. FACHB-1237]MBD2137874.1 DUF29 domain-containing protein [Anabaena sp. FACHB-1237]
MIVTSNFTTNFTTNLQQLYETDEHLWLLETIELLKQKRFDDLDLENLIEELESLAKRDQHKVKSLLEQIIRHLLLLQFLTEETENNSHHWQSEILGFRYQLEDRLTTNLRNYLANEMDNIYSRALKYVQVKTKSQIDFPLQCPYTLEQLLDVDYFK